MNKNLISVKNQIIEELENEIHKIKNGKKLLEDENNINKK
jgi:hypothetical protein